MYIKKQYSYLKENFVEYFCLEISVKTNSQDDIPFLRDVGDLVDKDTEWISIKNLNDKEFLKQHNIEYITEENQLTKEKEIIPIGLFEFNNNKFCNYKLPLWYVGSEDLYKAEHIIKNIEKAIKIKCETLKFKNKCVKNWDEEISLH